MKIRGAYKIARRGRSLDAYPDPLVRSEMRSQRILESLRNEIVGGAGSSLRIRQVFQSPREIFRLELELPEYCYQRTTLLDRDALEELLEADDVRQAVRALVTP
jgi:hypothetical protein